MRNDNSYQELKEYALAHLLIDLGHVDTSSLGDPITDEELSLLVEENPRASLGEQRCHELLAQIAQDQVLYQRWLILNESRILDGPFQLTSTASTPPPKHHWFTDLGRRLFSLEGLLTPRLNIATAFSLVGAAIVGTLLLTSEDPPRPELAVQPQNELPQKATMQQRSDGANQISAKDQISLATQCRQIQDTPVQTICYSKTTGIQHWFLVREYGITSLSAPSIDATKITSVSLMGNMLLIEYANPSGFVLKLFTYELGEHDWQLHELFSDSTSAGFFEGINLSTDTLSFTKVSGAGDKTSVNIAIDSL